jgi:hypothetical protein
MHIRRGMTRTVFITKRYAIKVPRIYNAKGYRVWNFLRGWLANQSEADFSEYASSGGYSKPQVAPVIKSYLYNLINVYPRAEVEYVEAKLDDLYDELEFKTPSDIHVGNLGYYRGNPVWLDYDQNWNDCKRCRQ